MKKLSLLLTMLLACSSSIIAQNEVPKPLDPDPFMLDWIDGEPYEWPDGSLSINSEFYWIMLGQDYLGNFVADDFPGNEAIWEAEDNGETLEYTILDRDKISFSLYTDFNRIYTFTPEKYEEFTEPTTIVPYTIFDGPTGDPDQGTYPHFAWDAIHFDSETNNGEEFGIKPLFYWRIGIQVHYTVDGVTNSSNIVYLEVNDKPVISGDLNDDGIVDISDVNIAINIALGKEDYNIKGDRTEDGIIDVSDINSIINIVLKKEE